MNHLIYPCHLTIFGYLHLDVCVCIAISCVSLLFLHIYIIVKSRKVKVLSLGLIYVEFPYKGGKMKNKSKKPCREKVEN